MATAKEILESVGAVDNTISVDLETRELMIPKTLYNLGVEFDDDTKVLNFRVPRFYHGNDLSVFKVRVNYINENGETDIYPVDNVVVTDDDVLTFSWTVGRHAYVKSGNVEFSLCFKQMDLVELIPETELEFINEGSSYIHNSYIESANVTPFNPETVYTINFGNRVSLRIVPDVVGINNRLFKSFTLDGDNYLFDMVIDNGRYCVSITHALGETPPYFNTITVCYDSDSIVAKELNTTFATLRVLRGIEGDEAVHQENPDIIEYLLNRTDEQVKSAISDYLDENSINWNAKNIVVSKVEAGIRVNVTLQDNERCEYLIELDENECPQSVVYNSVSCPVTWEGF